MEAKKHVDPDPDSDPQRWFSVTFLVTYPSKVFDEFWHKKSL